MSTRTYQDLIMWQKAKLLTLDVYLAFNSCSDYSFRNQIQRAAVSSMNNIAEGYGRKSNKAFKNFLFIARGSAIEVDSMLSLAKELNYINQITFNNLQNETVELIKITTAFINKLST